MSMVKKVRIVDPKDVASGSTPTAQESTVKSEASDNNYINNLASDIVTDVLDEAVFYLEAMKPIKNIKWITHGDFTAERGRQQISQFVSSWEFEDRWVHWTDYMRREDLGHSFLYLYRVHWSAPTAQRPVSRLSTYIDFTVKINKNKPPEAPIDVSYIMENQVLLQRPGKIRFREIWLKEAIESKYIMLEKPVLKTVLSISPTISILMLDKDGYENV